MRTATITRLCALALLLAVGGLGIACSFDERRASRLYDESREKLEQADVVEAVRLLDKIIEQYPDTDVAQRARQEVENYRDLAGAVERYPMVSARDLMIRAARAIETYHELRRSYPESLEQMVAEDLLPAPIDPWDRPLAYRQKPRGAGYVLACYGADGHEGGEGIDADLFIDTGEFAPRPPGDLP